MPFGGMERQKIRLPETACPPIYKGEFTYCLFGLLFGIFVFLYAIGTPISREEQAERDKELLRQLMEFTGPCP